MLPSQEAVLPLSCLRSQLVFPRAGPERGMHRLAAVWFPPYPLLSQPSLRPGSVPLLQMPGQLGQHSEQVRDNVVAVDPINHPLAVVVDEPAAHLCAIMDILPVVFLVAPGEGRDML